METLEKVETACMISNGEMHHSQSKNTKSTDQLKLNLFQAVNEVV